MIHLILFLCLLCSPLQASEVIELTRENFYQYTDVGHTAVEFYAPWCGHCQDLTPEWEEAAKTTKSIVFGKVDATKEEELAHEYNIRGYPTILLFEEGSATEYTGGRKATEIVEWMESRIQPPVREASSMESLGINTRNTGKISLALCYPLESHIGEAFTSHARRLRSNFSFFHVAECSTQSSHAVFMHKPFEEEISKFRGNLEDNEVFDAWLRAESFPALAEIGPDNVKSYMERGLPLAWLFVDPTHEERTSQALKTVRDVALRFRNNMSFVYLPGKEYAQIMNQLGHNGTIFPSFSIDRKTNEYYAFPPGEELEQKNLSEFCDAFFSGRLQRSLKSEPSPTQSLCEGLTTIVGTTFQRIVLDREQDTLVAFHAPWCEPCKKLMRSYRRLAIALQGSEINVAQIDVGSNDLSGNVTLSSLPTVLLFLNNKTEPLRYPGPYTAEGLLEFLKTHTNTEITVSEDDDLISDIAAEEILTLDRFRELLAEDTARVMLFTNTRGAKYYEYKRICSSLSEIANLAFVQNENIAHPHHDGSLVLYRPWMAHNERNLTFTGDISNHSMLTQWIKDNSFPLIDEINAEKHSRYASRGLPMLWLFAIPEDKESEKAKDVLLAVAEHFKTKMSCVWLNHTMHPRMASRFTLSGEIFPALAIDDLATRSFYVYPEERSLDFDSITKFTQDFLDDNLKRSLFSEPIPHRETFKGLTTLVSKTLEKYVNKGDKDLLLEFYSPECGYCQEFDPIYRKIALSLRPVSNLIVGSIDAVANEIMSSFTITGYPTLYFCPVGKEHILYEGPREPYDILEFVKLHATVDINITTKDLDNPKNIVEVLTDWGDLEDFKGYSDAALVCFAHESGQVASHFNATISLFPIYVDAAIYVCREIPHELDNHVVLFRALDNENVTFTGDLTSASELHEFLESEAFPLISEMNPVLHHRYEARGLPLVWILLNRTDIERSVNTLTIAQVVAGMYRKKFSFIHVDGSEQVDISDMFQFSGYVFPVAGIDDPESGNYYAMPETTEFTTQSLSDFLEEFLSGTLEPVSEEAISPESDVEWEQSERDESHSTELPLEIMEEL